VIESSSLLLVNDHDLKTDLAEFGESITRELYLASRKLEGSEVEFAAALRIIDRPLAQLRKWFRLLRVADLECTDTGLRFGGIDLAGNTFTSALGRLLRERGVKHVVFVPPVAPPELHAFLRALTQPAHEAPLAQKLAARGVRCLHINNAEWQSRLSARPVPAVDDHGHALIEDYVTDHWAHQPDLVCAAAAGGLPPAERLTWRWHCYATPQVLEAVLAGRFGELPSQAILEHARAQLEGTDRGGDSAPSRPSAAYWQGLLAAVSRHPYGYELTCALRELLQKEGLPLDVNTLLDSQVRTRFEATEVVDELTARVFSTACTVDDLKSWGAAFARLLKSGSSQQTATFLEALLLHLKRDDREARRKAHYLLGRALGAAAATDDTSIIRWLAERITADLAAGEETYECSDLLAGAGDLLAGAGQWDALSLLATRLRSLESGTLHPGRDRVCQVVLERWRRERWIANLFRAATEEQGGPSAVALLSALGGRDVALRASSLITHSQRRVRLSMLELLSGLGDEAVSICEDLLAPPELWTQRSGPGILADVAWYTIRNAFHILGRVGQERVLPVLRRHMGDPDSRVRLEIIRALERMGTQDARSLLVSFAEDRALDVRKAAVTALGTVGGDHEVFVVSELLRSDPELAECAILAMGHIGGRAAKDLLFRLIDGDATAFGPALAGRQEALREAALRALVQNPDSEIVAKIETYCREHNRTFRIPLVTDPGSEPGRQRFDKSRTVLPS